MEMRKTRQVQTLKNLPKTRPHDNITFLRKQNPFLLLIRDKLINIGVVVLGPRVSTCYMAKIHGILQTDFF